MAETLQYGSRGPVKRQNGLWISLRDDQDSSGPLTTLGTESLTPSETFLLDLPKQSILPGVPEERRFHRLYPEIIVPNDILRENLRRDHQLGTFDANATHTDHTCHLAMGHARGPQYRLHKCLLSVSASAQENLHVTLLRNAPIALRGDAQEQQSVKLAFDSTPVFARSFTSPIVQIDPCKGIPNSFFVVRTEQAVYCISIELQGEKRYADIKVNERFIVDPQVLCGQRPLSCILSYSMFLQLTVMTMDKMRVWITGNITSRTASSFHFKSFRTISGLPAAVFSLVPSNMHNSEPNLSQLLLVSEDRVDVMGLTEETVRNVLQLEPTEIIFSLDSIESNSSEIRDHFVMLTNQRIMIMRFVKRMEAVLSWKHYRRNPIHISVLRPIVDGSIHLLLYSKVDGLCTVFVASLSSVSRSISRPYRLSFECSLVPAYILSYPCCSLAHDSSTLVGLLLITQQGTLSSTVYSRDTNLSVHADRKKKIFGSALVREDDSEDSMNQNKVFQGSLKSLYKSSIDLSQWYKDYYRSRSRHGELESRRIDPRTTFSTPLQLGYELLDAEQDTDADTDSRLETMVRSYLNEHKFADSTPGLRIYDHASDVSDSEAYSAFALERLMRAWKGDPVLAIGRHRQDVEAAHDAQVHQAAQSLALSTAMFSGTIMSDALPIRLADLCVIPKPASDGRTLSRILDEWDVEKDPRDYVWHNIESNPDKSLEPSSVPVIPRFGGARNIPTGLSSSQYAPPVVSSTQAPHPMSSQGESQITMTQPVAGKFGVRKQKKRKKAGF